MQLQQFNKNQLTSVEKEMRKNPTAEEEAEDEALEVEITKAKDLLPYRKFGRVNCFTISAFHSADKF